MDNPMTPATEFLQDFAEMSRHGATPGGGVDRQAASPEDHATRAWFGDWLARHGLAEAVDGIGNQFGLATLCPGAPYILVGSHLDSQPLAGRYDGAYGVLAAAHAVAALAAEAGSGGFEPRYNLAVVNWFNEEGSRFTPSMMGSSVFTGKLDLERALATTDAQGTSVAAALAAGSASPARSVGQDAAAPRLADVAGYAEIHVEQGRVLEETDTQIGLVDRTWAAAKYRVTVRGAQSHTGSTRMHERRDALYGASLVIAGVRELTEEFAPGLLHTSVSELYVLPNSPVTIAREATMNVDLRSPDESVLARAMDRLDALVRSAAERSATDAKLEPTHRWGLLSYQSEGVELARRSAEGLGFSHRRVMTVAGHDSTNMLDAVPTVMLFVPSVDGISHNEAEYTRDEDALRGVELLTDVVRRMCRGE